MANQLLALAAAIALIAAGAGESTLRLPGGLVFGLMTPE